MTRACCIALLILWAAAACAGPCVVSAPLLPSAPVIDGDLSDPAWRQAGVVPGFVTARQADPEIASPLTTMRVGYTEQALYLAFECAEPNLHRLVAAPPERDYAMNKADSVSLYFDFAPQWNDERYIEIAHDCGDVYHDSYARDHDWTGAWTCKTGRTPDAWTVEFCIPFDDVRAVLAGGDAWWLSIGRNRLAGSGQQVQSWCPSPRGVRTAQAAGRLIFGSLAGNAAAGAVALAAAIDGDLTLLRDEAARTDDGRTALGEIETIRAQAQTWTAPADESMTPEQWQARHAEIERAQARYRDLFWTVRFAALLEG